MVMTPLFALGVFFKYGAFTSNEGARIYYAVTYLAQSLGSNGLGIVIDAWGQELAEDPVDRSKLYSTVGIVSFIFIVVVINM